MYLVRPWYIWPNWPWMLRAFSSCFTNNVNVIEEDEGGINLEVFVGLGCWFCFWEIIYPFS